jgi:UDP-3-O-[3-hydroxymyristoyl] glucosamine N-acyltransferase
MRMEITLKELVAVVGGELVGDGSVPIRGGAGIREAGPGDITFLASKRYSEFLKTTRASAVIVPPGMQTGGPAVVSPQPYLTFVKVVEFFRPGRQDHPRTVHPTAVIAPDVRLGTGVGIGACCVIETGAEIGDGTVILAGTYIGAGCRLGVNCLIYPNVTIREETSVGDRVIIHSGAVLGSDGFGFVRDGDIHKKVPQLGNVSVGDDVEIGANVTIDRATSGSTSVGTGTKIDNLVQIGHNVTIRENCILVAQVGVGGSTEVGRGASLAGQAGAVGHIKIGEGAVVAAQAGAVKDVPPDTVVSGYPAREHNQAKRIYASLVRLPELLKRVGGLLERVEKLERRLKDD